MTKYDDLKWEVSNNCLVDDGRDTTLGSIVSSNPKKVFGFLPMGACHDIVDLHNATLGTLEARLTAEFTEQFTVG